LSVECCNEKQREECLFHKSVGRLCVILTGGRGVNKPHEDDRNGL
jgi:hypothetical protein